MDTRKKIEKLSDADFQLYLGIDRPTFYIALEILETENKIQRKKGGTPLKTSIFERLVITLNYYREYRSLRHIAIDYGISKSKGEQCNLFVREIKSIDTYVFRIEADTPELRLAVEKVLERLRKEYPNYDISAIYGYGG